MSECRGFLLEKAAEWDLPRTGEWNFLFSNNYQPNYSTLALLWFHNGSEFPRVVTKLIREPQVLTQEFKNLREVYRCAPHLVPKPLHLGLQGEFWALWMEGAPGWRFDARERSAPSTLRSMVEMLGAMHGALRQSGAERDPGRYSRVISGPVRTLAQFGQSASVADECARLLDRANASWLDSQPVIPQHGDLFPGNLLHYGQQWHVLDWESFGIVDLPFYDLFTLLLSLLCAKGYNPEQWSPALVKQIPGLIECYARRLGLSPADAPLLLPLTLANWFHVQWSDDRGEFINRMYPMIEHYCEHTDRWRRIFFSS